ncbi:dTDP-4-dehydrorhamnose 3,5-epimerase family protein [Nocardiopsis kunsanensis]|uniref:dTDP-4-dehydrorhamnose 3,5-epimerase family protein n=1 Tax=Nocardiopsis kunsanensis TaxID=141693 RepID=UPI000349CF94|nr:dTDP-4-dehydrorhamnose 3,5-epimerase family protein [Nocardiopsis kunsanensis]
MRIRPLAIDGAWEITPRQHHDRRGKLFEAYASREFADVVGRPFSLEQMNVSVSIHGAVRGVHVTSRPPGQAKYVSCVRGAVWDVVVDLRPESPTFGRHDAALLDDRDHRAVYLGEGLGHAVCALEDDSALVYLSSSLYAPGLDVAVDPLDPELAIPWPVEEPTLSARDRAAPSLEETLRTGLLSPNAVGHGGER